jgi:glycosyltransferase involved in cell wall biosynthesis
MQNEIIINGRFLTQKLAGVHRYAFEMCCTLHKLGYKFIVLAPQEILSEYEYPFEVKIIGKLSSHFWEQIELPIYLYKHYRNHILISFTGLGSVLYNKNICTIHDLSFLENPAWFSKSYYYLYKYLTPLVARRALKIITVSEFSKSEIVNRMAIPAEKIEVIYNAVSEKLIKSDKQVSTGNKYLLSVSSIDPRKNQIKLIEAFKILNNKDYKLYFIGEKNKVFGKQNKLDNNDPNIVFTGYLNDSELSHFYRNATIFIYPSLYEGFGIPNLEAMANSCPVITSSIPPHLEVCQDAVLYINPNDPIDIANKIRLLINDLNLRNELAAKGEKRIKLFSWQNSARKLIDLLDRLVM